MNETLDRRSFIGIAGASAAITAGVACIPQAHADEAKPWIPEWDEEADIVIAGFGMAGAMAAMNAADDGLSVILLEAAPQDEAGGETCVSGGFIVANPGNHNDMTTLTLEDAKVSCMNDVYDEYLNTIIPYFNDVMKNIKDLGIDLDTTSMPGLAFASSAEAGCAGYALYEILEEAVAQRDIEVVYEMPVFGLVQDPVTGEALGFKAGTSDNPTCYKAKRGVVIATGGYEGNLEMTNAIHANGALFPTLSSPHNTGAGLKMLMKAGAKTQNFDHCLEYSNAAFKKASEEVGTAIVIGQGVGGSNQCSNGWILVNREGKRFMAESNDLMHCKYTRKLSMIEYSGDAYSDMTNSGFMNLPCWLILDEATLNSGPLARKTGDGGWGWNSGYPGHHNLWVWSDDNQAELEKGWLVKADTLEELAALCTTKDHFNNDVQLSADGLVAEVEHYNEMCANGVDDDFGADPDWMVALGDGPYYAAEMTLSTIYTTGGPLVDAKTCVALNWDENPIPRLHAAGEVASVYNLHSPSLVGACATGRLCAEHIASLEPWDE